MFKTLVNAFKVKELRNKILLTLLLLFIYRIGCWLPVPGINVEVFKATVENEFGGFLNLLSSIGGGALSNGAFLALGVGPYISAQLCLMVLKMGFPSLRELDKTPDGQRKSAFYNRLLGLVLSIAQAAGFVFIALGDNIDPNVLWSGAPDWLARIFIVVMLAAGGMFTVWLGERINDLGIGNGLSLLIFVGILSTAGTSLLSTITQLPGNIDYLWNILIFLAAVIVIFSLIVLIDTAERRINFQISQHTMKGGAMKNTRYLPLKLVGSGVTPVIFASYIFMFPQVLMSIFWPDALTWYSQYLGAGSWVYIVLSSILIVVFSFFIVKGTQNVKDISKNLQQNGISIQGRKPGSQTAEYLGKVQNRIVLVGSIFLALINFIPSVIFTAIGGTNTSLVNAFSATGLMVVVSVAIELNKSLEQQLIVRNHRGFLK